MAGGAKNRNQGQNRGKGSKAKRPTTTSAASSTTDAPSPMSPDQEFALGYFDVVHYYISNKNPRMAVDFLDAACQLQDSLALLHYWRAAAALEVAYDIHRGVNYGREELLSYLRRAHEAAHHATTKSPYDIEFHRFYIEILAEEAIFEERGFNEAVQECKQALSLPEDTVVFEEKLCLTRNKETTIEAIRERCNWMQENQDSISRLAFPLLRPVYFYVRVDKEKNRADKGKNKQINTTELMPETEQKKWRRACWDSMSDDKKVEFLSMKYEDLRTFFLDKQLERAKIVLTRILSKAVRGSNPRIWFCYACATSFQDCESHMQHVWEKHIGSLPEHMKEQLPKEDICRTSLPTTGGRTLLLAFDPARFVLHMCTSTIGEVSFEPEFLKCSLPDPDTFISLLNSDKHVEEQKNVVPQEAALIGRLKNNFNELRLLCWQKYKTLTITRKAIDAVECLFIEELKKMDHQKASVLQFYEAVQKSQCEQIAITKDNVEDAILIQSEDQISSYKAKSELVLGKYIGVMIPLEQLEAHITFLLKSNKEKLSKECDSIESKIRKNITRNNQLECELSRYCFIDFFERLIPHLGLFLKVQLADFVYAYATEQTQKSAEQLWAEEANEDFIGGSNPSKQFVKNSKRKTKIKERVPLADHCHEDSHQQEADLELMPSAKVDGLHTESSQQSDTYLQQHEEKPQTDSYLEQERKMEKALPEKVIQQKKEETTTSYDSIAQGQSTVGLSSAISDKDTENSSTLTKELILIEDDHEDDSIWQSLLINVVILPLCDLKPFCHELGMKLSLHEDIRSPCVVCELGDMVIAFGEESVKERAGSSMLGKFSFSNLVGASYRLQQARFNAPDVLLAIFDCLHESFTSSGDPAAKLSENTLMSVFLCESGTCLVHKLFGINIAELTTYPCGLKARHEKCTFFHSVTAKELCRMKVTCAGSSFEEILKNVALNHQFICKSTCGCKMYSNLCQKLLNHPHIFVAAMNWETDNSANDVSATVRIISDEIDLSALFDGVESSSQYFLQSMICCSLKYVCFIHDFEHESWFLYNGKNIEEIGGWDAVVSKCEVGSFRPEVLMYVLKED